MVVSRRRKNFVAAVGTLSAGLVLSPVLMSPAQAASGAPGVVRVQVGPQFIRSVPNTYLPAIGSYSNGSWVSLGCKVNGENIWGDPVWYKLANRSGWMSARYIHAHGQVPWCGTGGWDRNGNWIGNGGGERGPKGDRGPTGPAGPAGLVGPKGDTGATGPAGAQGPQGEIGAAGPTGPTGPAGTNGTNGTNGAVGATGATGPIGPAGVQGPAGPAGSVGPAGPTGPAGVNGIDGANGVPKAAQVASQLFTVGAGLGTQSIQTVACSTGTVVTGGGFVATTTNTVDFEGSTPNGNGWKVSVRNLTLSSQSYTVYAMCMPLS